MPRNERCDQGKERIEIGGEIDVHVGNDRGITAEPGVTNGPTATLLAKTLGPNAGQLECERAGDVPGAVGAGVVDDGDPRRKREARVEVGAEPADVGLEVALFVVDRNGDIDDRHALIVHPDSCRFRDRPLRKW